MTDTAARYQIRIMPVRVPESLQGIPLPVEIIPEAGQGRRVSITLSNEPVSEAVGSPGRYLVRAALPSGNWITDVAIVPEASDVQHTTFGDATLTFSTDYGPDIVEFDDHSEMTQLEASNFTSIDDQWTTRFPAKDVLFSTEARNRIVHGVELLKNAVKITLGPNGRNVVIEKSFGAPRITKDGVAVAKEIELADKFENLGGQLIREVASKQNDIAGDGTTTATILAASIVREGTKAVAAGFEKGHLE